MRYRTDTVTIIDRPRSTHNGVYIAGQSRTVTVKTEIDEDAIAAMVGRKAGRSKRGQSTALSGLIKARVLRQ